MRLTTTLTLTREIDVTVSASVTKPTRGSPETAPEGGIEDVEAVDAHGVIHELTDEEYDRAVEALEEEMGDLAVEAALRERE